MRVVFVHGWSVTNTNAYGGLPRALARNAPPGLKIEVSHVRLGKYVSFADEVTVDDIARAMQHAVAAEVIPLLAEGERFACVTHSTGGPVVRKWIDLYYGADKLASCPMSHFVMLAPANHGSALAQLGKSRLSRMKFFMDGVEPGTKVLDWLELGSRGSWNLNESWLDYDFEKGGLFPFVLTGQKIDRQFYDNLNSYTGEEGSDGVVRVAAANMNFGLLRLAQQGDELRLDKQRQARPSGFGLLPQLAHSGDAFGIMGSVRPENESSHPTVEWVLQCLAVEDAASYRKLIAQLSELTDKTQEKEKRERAPRRFVFSRVFETFRYSMLVFHVVDDRGDSLDDYDIIFTAGPNYDPDLLPPGFFVDRQRNQRDRGKLTYFLNYDKFANGIRHRKGLDGKFGIIVRARPDSGFAHYRPLSYQGTLEELKHYIQPNQTVMIEIQLERHVDENVFRLADDLEPGDIDRKWTGKYVR